jgi:hypothetical protein
MCFSQTYVGALPHSVGRLGLGFGRRIFDWLRFGLVCRRRWCWRRLRHGRRSARIRRTGWSVGHICVEMSRGATATRGLEFTFAHHSPPYPYASFSLLSPELAVRAQNEGSLHAPESSLT